MKWEEFGQVGHGIFILLFPIYSSIHSLDMVTSGSTMVSSVIASTTNKVIKQKSSSFDETGNLLFY